ncbi:3-hydroxyacyl-CoA dehydrogenase family protein [Ferruginibacter sp. HRS2-29]|uniref:3-hydroxyacyl-CoA dehydrogenase family protein n=1 Tax=Ferruginibacter sp. HRS2-29 TaxID=2487334 RepID=UPI0020CD7C65|nr:3-hydroxyacyl-CoA dehydrogenase NAD-binding domain-containing protein [Ferruginibacter sp. HRS2-29]MCP9750429.1 3-hydroxybutyryl-CoA dehydrogenase [Ferruginibacter sp. HRS2-29]
MIKKVCVVGAGTMGSGIALTAAQNGFEVVLFDINENVLESAKLLIGKNLDFLISKEKISEAQKTVILQHLLFTTNADECLADIVIEAIVEKLEAKEKIFISLAAINAPSTILASNTSSLSITAIQKNIPSPGRVVGMHFFNPANVMKLVEVVKGAQTDDATASEVMQLCLDLKKTPVLCNDAPGFIVNRVARHYYLEAMKLVEQKIATIENVDAAMEAAGFKMGPFRLMDLIGMDINYAVSESVYAAFDNAERFRPSPIQKEKVEKGELGKKTGKGFYQYS